MDDHLFGDLLGGDPFAELSGSRFPPPVAHSSSPEPDLRRAHCSLVAAIEDIDGGSIPARLPMSGGARLSICARRNLVAVVETLSEVGSLLGDNTKEESRVTLRTWCKNGQLSQAALLLIVNVRDERLACRELPPEQVGNARAVHFHPGVDWMAVVGVDRVSLWERSVGLRKSILSELLKRLLDSASTS